MTLCSLPFVFFSLWLRCVVGLRPRLCPVLVQYNSSTVLGILAEQICMIVHMWRPQTLGTRFGIFSEGRWCYGDRNFSFYVGVWIVFCGARSGLKQFATTGLSCRSGGSWLLGTYIYMYILVRFFRRRVAQLALLFLV